MEWQYAMLGTLAQIGGDGARVAASGSAADGALDAWSDLDAHLDLPDGTVLPLDALDGSPLWAWQDTVAGDEQVVRLVLADGRRVDLRVTGGRIALPTAPADLGIRFDLALAAVRAGRGDALIASHLLLGALRETLVTGMLLRDRDEGVDRHRHGTARDRTAAAVAAIAGADVLTRERPHPVERAAALDAGWRRELDPEHHADWTGLTAVLDRGLGGGLSGGFSFAVAAT